MTATAYRVETYSYLPSRSYGMGETYDWQTWNTYPTRRRAENAVRRQINDYGERPERVRIVEVS